MIGTQFKRGMGVGLRLMVPFLSVMILYGGVVVWMYDPQLSQMLDQYQRLMPGLMAAVGMDGDTGTLNAFLHTYLYGLLFALIPFVYTAMLLYRQLIRPLDDRSLACIIASPHSRKSIVLTILFTTFLQLAILVIFCAAFNFMVSEWLFPGELDFRSYWKLNLSCLALHAALGSIVYFFSCALQNQRRSLMLGTGIPLFMYLLNSMARMGDTLRPLRYFTVFTLFSQDMQALQGGIFWPCLTLLGIALLLIGIGTAIFSRRDLML